MQGHDGRFTIGIRMHFGARQSVFPGGGTQVVALASHQSPGATQLPPEHVSLMVQPFPSSQGMPLFGSEMQAPFAGLHRSFIVQTLSSMQSFVAPPRQMLDWHESFCVQKLPSSQG